MYPRKPLPHAEQVSRLKKLVRRLETELKHRYDEYFEVTRGRRDCPLESSIRRRCVEQARDAVGLAQACLLELHRQEAMFYAPFKPGDRVTVARVDKSTPAIRGPYLITDVQTDKRSRYRYVVVPLTKEGRMHKRQSDHWVVPDDKTSVSSWTGATSEEGEWEAKYFKGCAEHARTMAFERGDLSLFEVQTVGFSSTIHYRRKDRMPSVGAGESDH